MADKSEFWELYKHPNWQKKRLEVMEEAGFQCSNCGNKDKNLNVHHTYYRKDAKPWEYENSELKCLCKDCHKQHHELSDELKKLINESDELGEVIGFLKGKSGLPCKINSHEEVVGFLLAYEIPHIVLQPDGTRLCIDTHFIKWIESKGYFVNGGEIELEYKPLLKAIMPSLAHMLRWKEPKTNG